MNLPRTSVGRNGLRPYIAIEEPWAGILRKYKPAMELLALVIAFISLFIGPLGVYSFLLSLLLFIGIRRGVIATADSGSAKATGMEAESRVVREDEGDAED
jgi:hypothetical protein